MSKQSTSRRTFLKGGALLAGPIAVASVPAVALAQGPADGLSVRLRHLEDESAIRAVHQSWLRQINAGGGLALLAGTVTRLSADHAGAADKIEIAADGYRATGEFACAADVETQLPADSTLAQMAHAQGSGMVRTTQRLRLTVEYIKVAGAWTMGSIGSQAA